MKIVAAKQVTFHPFSQGCCSGRVFSWTAASIEQSAQSGLRSTSTFYRGASYRDLIRRQHLIDTEISDLELDGYAFVLKHRTVPFVSDCYEWCGEMPKVISTAAT